MMGRETKILLGLLGTLSTTFAGVLGSKLLIPRPPEGAGPDVHQAAGEFEPSEIVEPPSFERRERSAFTAAAEAEVEPLDALSSVEDLLAPPANPAWRSDPLEEADAADTTADTTAGVPEPSADPPVPATFSPPPVAEPLPVEPQRIPPGRHVVTPGETWWSIAERAYGDGRLYRGLYAWNRVLDPQVSLAPGTNLEIPTATRLAAAHPATVPAAEASSGVVLASAGETSGGVTTASARAVTVQPGDTLLSIARESLGSSRRWREIYAANADLLGHSPGPLIPGTRLVLPAPR